MNDKFINFKSANPQWENTYNVYTRDSSTYKRIICPWDEGSLKHEYHAIINVDSGDIYIDCSRKKLFAKHLTLGMLRPIHTIIKTLWHMTIILPFIFETIDLARGKTTLKQFGLNNVRSLADIIRTPLYGLAITVMHAAALVLAIYPNSLYSTSALIGRMERSFLRTDFKKESHAWALAACFSPCRNIAEGRDPKDIVTERSVRSMLTKFARINIELMREKNRNCFIHYLPENTAYKG